MKENIKNGANEVKLLNETDVAVGGVVSFLDYLSLSLEETDNHRVHKKKNPQAKVLLYT